MTTLLLLARGFHFGGGMILVGVVAFRWLILLPAFAGETDEVWQTFLPLFRRLQQLYLIAVIVLVLSGFALFWAVAAGMSGDSLAGSLDRKTLSTVLFQTQFGDICQWRLGLAVVLGIMAWRLGRKSWQARHRSPLEMVAAFVAVALMVSVAGTGHAAASGGHSFPWRIAADGTHLLASAIWPTGLLPFALFLARARQVEKAIPLAPVLAVTRRFSALSLLTVGVLILTGFINSCYLVGSFQALATTGYGRLLSLKLFLFLFMLGIAAWNRFRILPLLFTRATLPDRNGVLFLIQRLQGFVLTEFGLGMAIVAVVSVLGTTPPPR